MQLILRSISYSHIKVECTLFYYKKEELHSDICSSRSDIDYCFQEHNFYSIKKGKVEMIIDHVKYHIGSILTKSMIKNVTGRQMFLKEGDILTVKDLLYAMICGGYNDATNILALTISTTLTDFTNQMNEKAKPPPAYAT